MLRNSEASCPNFSNGNEWHTVVSRILVSLQERAEGARLDVREFSNGLHLPLLRDNADLGLFVPAFHIHANPILSR